MDGLCKSFRYPVGYFEAKNRLRDAGCLSEHDALLHPYLVVTAEERIFLDNQAPTGIQQICNALKGDRNDNLRSAIRFLELGAMPDKSMEATYQQEDALAWAANLSEAGHHGEALKIIGNLPNPFQETLSARCALLRSLKALGRFKEALVHSFNLIEHYKGGNVHSYQLQVIETAELLVECGLVEDAGQMLDAERQDLLRHYTYYGVRAAIALSRGDRELAKCFIGRAAMTNAYHCYKLIWQRSLEPLHFWMAQELLTEGGDSRPDHEQTELLRICHRIQGLALSGDLAQARDMADALVPSKLVSPGDASRLLLAWLSVGEFARARRWASALPRFPSDKIHRLIEQTCDLFLPEGDPSRPESKAACDRTDFSPEYETALRQLAGSRGHSNGEPPEFAFPRIIAEVWRGSWRSGRQLWVVTWHPDGRIERTAWTQPKGMRPERRLAGYDPRGQFESGASETFASKHELAIWLEAALAENDGVEFGMYCRPRRSFRFGCTAMLSLYSVDELQGFERLVNVWQNFRKDPELYFVALSFVDTLPETIGSKIYQSVSAVVA